MCWISGTSFSDSRLKDYLDLWVLLDHEALNANTLSRAIAATFMRRGIPVPTVLPIGLTDEFTTDVSRQAMWQAFQKKRTTFPIRRCPT